MGMWIRGVDSDAIYICQIRGAAWTGHMCGVGSRVGVWSGMDRARRLDGCRKQPAWVWIHIHTSFTPPLIHTVPRPAPSTTAPPIDTHLPHCAGPHPERGQLVPEEGFPSPVVHQECQAAAIRDGGGGRFVRGPLEAGRQPAASGSLLGGWGWSVSTGAGVIGWGSAAVIRGGSRWPPIVGPS